MIGALRRHGSPEGALESLYRDHAADVYRYALAMLGSPADAEDATQATFLNAFRAIDRGDEPRQPRAWLRMIVHNLCLQQFRQLSRRPEQVELDEDAGELVVDDAAPALEDVIRGLKHLPFNQRAALVMREFEGRTIVEIGEGLGVTTAAVETLLFRARRSLREQLEESLTCAEAERAISRQVDGMLPRSERGALRAHLRECKDCAAYARRVRAQQRSMRSLALLPLPAGLSWSHWGGATGVTTGAAAASTAAPVGVSLLVKLAAVVLTTGAVGGLGYAGEQKLFAPKPLATPAAARARPQLEQLGRPGVVIAVRRRSAYDAVSKDGPLPTLSLQPLRGLEPPSIAVPPAGVDPTTDQQVPSAVVVGPVPDSSADPTAPGPAPGFTLAPSSGQNPPSPNQPGAGQGNAGQGNSGQSGGGQGDPGQGNPGQGNAGQGNLGQGNGQGQGNAGQGNPGQGQGSAGQGNSGQGQGNGPGGPQSNPGHGTGGPGNQDSPGKSAEAPGHTKAVAADATGNGNGNGNGSGSSANASGNGKSAEAPGHNGSGAAPGHTDVASAAATGNGNANSNADGNGNGKAGSAGASPAPPATPDPAAGTPANAADVNGPSATTGNGNGNGVANGNGNGPGPATANAAATGNAAGTGTAG